MSYYHVRINTGSYSDIVKLDLSEDQLMSRIVNRYLEGRPIVIGGVSTDPLSIGYIFISETTEPSTLIYRTGVGDPWDFAHRAADVTDDFITEPAGTFSAAVAPSQEPPPSSSSNPRTVFVVHGRNDKAAEAMFSFLTSLGLNPLEWERALHLTGDGSPYIGDVLQAAFTQAQAIVVLLTPDDEAILKETFRKDGDEPAEKVLTGQARPNVLFEAGMAMGYNPSRTILVELGTLKPFSDVSGRHAVRLDDSSEKRQALAMRLEIAGCEVDRNGTRWHSVGRFNDAVV